jgi:subtilisin-like proprotein convertase family protein
LAADAAVEDAPALDAELDAAPPTDAMIGSGFFLDDVAADFAGGTLTGAVVESWGAVAPRAYYTGGLRVRGSDSGLFTDAATATWSAVDGSLATSPVAPARALTVAWGTAIPAGVGLTGADDLVMGYDGEIYLEAGSWSFHLLADDHGFLELAPPGGAFVRVASANWPTEASGSFTAATTGWYAVRLGYCEQTGGAQLRVELSGPGVPSRGPVPRHRLRFDATGLTGMVVAGFDDGRLLGDHQVSIDRTSPAGRSWSTGQPGDLGLTGGDDFSVRWSGQLRVDVDGDFTFRYLSEDGQRLWIDGALVLDQFDDASHDASTSPVHLDPGWHALVVDHTESTGAAQAFLGVTAGPELVGASLPADRLRPVEPRGERYDGGVDHTDRAIPDLGQVESTITVDAPPGAKTAGVDVSWTFDHTYRGDLEIWLVAPDGSSVLVRDHVGGAMSGSVTERVHLTSLDETIASGTWRLRVRDTTSLDSGTLRDFQLTVHHRGGRPPITPVAVYDSAVKDLGEMITAYTSFGWSARLGAGSSVRVRVRSGDSEDACRNATWSSPLVDPAPTIPPVQARRYFQYRLELDSDGDGAAIVDWVRLDTRREIP